MTHSPYGYSAESSKDSRPFLTASSRSELVNSRGRASQINDRLNPYEAMVDDLNFIRRALDAGKIGYFLVRGSEAHSGAIRPTIAVNDRDRESVVRALTEACADEPMYSKPVRAKAKRSKAVLISTKSLGGGPDDRAFVLFRSRVTTNGLLRLGARYGVRLEFWVYEERSVYLPNGNAVTRAVLPLDEVKPTTVSWFGSTWPTLVGMWNPLADDIAFPIDIVFSWVDGTDLEWQRARALTMQSYVVGEGDDHEARFRQIDELKYALRSVNLYAPWIRNIFIVTDSARPEWLEVHPRVVLMPSSEFFSDVSVLPTHNSHAVESQLHRIPGLSEHFIYSNDDMFFGREVTPQGFFTSGGMSRFIESHTRIGMGEPNPSRSGFENAARVNRAILFDKFGLTISRNLEHSPAPLRRSVLEKLESEFPHEFARTASARFRSVTDVSVTNSLYHYFALMTGMAVPQDSMRVKYVDTTSVKGIASLDRLLRERNFDFFCLNDGSFPTVSAQDRLAAVTTFLEGYYPIPAPWERGFSEADALNPRELPGHC